MIGPLLNFLLVSNTAHDCKLTITDDVPFELVLTKHKHDLTYNCPVKLSLLLYCITLILTNLKKKMKKEAMRHLKTKSKFNNFNYSWFGSFTFTTLIVYANIHFLFHLTVFRYLNLAPSTKSLRIILSLCNTN